MAKAIPTGILAGSLGAMCGVGGGLVIIPVLKQFTKMSVHQITATSLFSITIASSVGAASYISQGVAHVPEAGTIALTAMLSAGVGAKVSANMPAATLTKLLGLTMLAAVPAILLKPTKVERKSNETDNSDGSKTQGLTFYLGRGAPDSMAMLVPWMFDNYTYLFLGGLVGFSSSLLGIGGGILMTSVMSTLYDMPQHEAVATSLVAMVPTGLAATLHQRANVHGRAAIMIGTSCAIAMYGATTFVAPKVSESDMRKIFAAVLAFSSFRILI